MGTPTSVELLVVTRKATATIEANRVVLQSTTEGSVTATSAITDVVAGVSQHKATVGQAISIEKGHGASVRVTAGDTITVGMRLMPKASGDGKVVQAAGATAFDCGFAESAGADGDTIVMNFSPMGKSPVNA